jgi:hypothetical protein
MFFVITRTSSPASVTPFLNARPLGGPRVRATSDGVTLTGVEPATHLEPSA